MPDTAPPSPLTHPMLVRQLPTRKVTRFDLIPDEAVRAALAAHAGLLALPFLRFRGEVQPRGRHDLRLDLMLAKPRLDSAAKRGVLRGQKRRSVVK